MLSESEDVSSSLSSLSLSAPPDARPSFALSSARMASSNEMRFTCKAGGDSVLGDTFAVALAVCRCCWSCGFPFFRGRVVAAALIAAASSLLSSLSSSKELCTACAVGVGPAFGLGDDAALPVDSPVVVAK